MSSNRMLIGEIAIDVETFHHDLTMLGDAIRRVETETRFRVAHRDEDRPALLASGSDETLRHEASGRPFVLDGEAVTPKKLVTWFQSASIDGQDVIVRLVLRELREREPGAVDIGIVVGAALRDELKRALGGIGRAQQAPVHAPRRRALAIGADL